MIKVADLRRVVRAELKKLGFDGANSDWWYPEGEVKWSLHLDTAAWGKELSISHHLTLPDGASAVDPGYPDVTFFIDKSAPYPIEESWWEAWYINTDLDIEERYSIIRRSLAEMAEYTRRHLTLESVRAAYETDYKHRPFIHWRARNFFEGRPLDQRPIKSGDGGKIIMPEGVEW